TPRTSSRSRCSSLEGGNSGGPGWLAVVSARIPNPGPPPMSIEIERKFLVTNDAWRAAAHEVVPMAQGYINDRAAMDRGAQRASVRVRIAGDEAFLNLKSRDAGHTRQEFDYPIPIEDGRALLALCAGGLVEKRRH